jgi:hypothetical protein
LWWLVMAPELDPAVESDGEHIVCLLDSPENRACYGIDPLAAWVPPFHAKLNTEDARAYGAPHALIVLLSDEEMRL